jgi:hypothetical protein
MASGITTNTTLADIDIKVVIPELIAGLKIPGIAPNAELTLIANDNSSGLITSVTNPELVTGSVTSELTTTENIPATNITLGKFVRGLESLNLKNPVYNKLGKVVNNTSIFADFFNRRVRYVRQITDSLKPTALSTTFFVNKNTIDKAALQDLLSTRIIYGRSFIDVTKFIDFGTKYKLSTNYTNSTNITIKTLMALYRGTISENLILQDSYNRIWYSFRNFLETKTFSEVMQFYSNVLKYNTLSITENIGKKLNLHASDFKQALDVFNSQVGYKRKFTDILNTTDDYYGLANVDDDQYAGFYKQTRDFLATQESFTRAVAVTLVDISDVSDPFFRIVSYNRIFTGNTETVNKSDTVNKNPNIFKYETILKQDYYSRIVNFYRAVNETPKLFEQKLLRINSNIVPNITSITDKKSLLYSYNATTENITNTNIFSRQVSYIRKVTNYINTTDDYYGLANIDDDQYAGFYKQTRDYLTFQESRPIKSVSITTTPSIADISDPYISIAVFNRAFTDSTNRSDTVSKNFKSIKSDEILKQDYYSRIANFYRAVNETQSLLEQKILYISSFLANANASAIDKNLIFLRKYPNTETIIGTDSNYTRTNFIRNIAEYIDATDDYYGLANIDDDQYTRVNKGIVDTISFVEKVTPVSFILYTPITESSSTNQELRKFVRKFPSVDIANIDNIEYTSIKVNKRANNEIFYKFDQSSNDFSKVLIDIIKFTDFVVTTKQLNQLFLETSRTNSTNIKLNPKKVFRDTKTVFDYYFYRVTYGRDIIETLTINNTGDKKYVRIGKRTANETTHITESIQRLIATYIKLYDTVDATDDYYGLANVDDDQYARIAKKFNDNYTAKDYLKYRASIKFTDNYIARDSLKYSASIKFTDNYIARDSLKYRASIKFTDIFNKTEKITLKTTLQSVDSTHFTETFVYSKYSSDGGIQKVFIDQIFKSDSGLINNQNYFADKYVAPGYAGTNRTIF